MKCLIRKASENKNEKPIDWAKPISLVYKCGEVKEWYINFRLKDLKLLVEAVAKNNKSLNGGVAFSLLDEDHPARKKGVEFEIVLVDDYQ